MNGIAFPRDFRLEPLEKTHPRCQINCGQGDVNDWLRTKTVQHQEKRLFATGVLLDESVAIAGFYTLATGQVDFGDLPSELVHRLPRRALPVAVIAWLGVSQVYQGRKLGDRISAIVTRRARRSRSWP